MSWAIWITGPPDSGKSAIARAAARLLEASGERARVLELDDLHATLTPVAHYTEAERELVYRSLAFIARTLVETGTPVIVDATAHRGAWRDLARRWIPRFAEVQLGVDVRHERTGSPELTIDTAREDVQRAARRVTTLALRLGASAPVSIVRATAGWVLWITGLPGSGKTTLATRVASIVTSPRAPVIVLGTADLYAAILNGRLPAPGEEDIVYRALIALARLLSDTGVSVIIDATAPRRAWRALARATIERFAEVQLVCARDLCLSRERAARWGLSGATATAVAGAAAVPDLVFDYEPAYAPELTLRTDVGEVFGSVAQIIRLVERLRRNRSMIAEPAPP